MASEIPFGYGEFSPIELENIGLDWAMSAFSSHQAVASNISRDAMSVINSSPNDIAPSLLKLEDVDGICNGELSTPVLPDDCSVELLGEPDRYFLDSLVAGICSCLTSLSIAKNAAGGSFLAVSQSFDTEEFAERFKTTRAEVAKLAQPFDNAFYSLPNSSDRIALVSTNEQGLFNVAIRSSYVFVGLDSPIQEDTATI